MSLNYNLSSILKSVGAIVDQEATLPTGSDLVQRIQFANDALGEWADTYTWNELKQTIYVNPTDASTSSLALPLNFRQPYSALVKYNDDGSKTTYEVIKKEDRFSKLSSDNYCFISGTFGGKSLNIPNILPSGASLQMDYISFASSLATLTDYAPISASQYLVKKVSGLVLQGRGDPRFPLILSEAQRLLSNAIEEQNVPFGRVNRIPYTTGGMVLGEE